MPQHPSLRACLGLSLITALLWGCSSAQDASLTPVTAKPAVRPNGPPVESTVDIYSATPIGWASVNDLGQDGTTGGGDLEPVAVNTIEELTAAAAGATPMVIHIASSMEGSFNIGSNKTVEGLPGVTFTGHIGFNRSVNVILRNLTIVGFNCTDLNPGETCQDGADAVTISRSTHIWVDHCDVSDGSDGNLDVVSASDYVTISWTKFWYRGRVTDHQFSNLLGSSDGSTGDAGHLKVTFHHDLWGDGVRERMPRARFGWVHLFNNLYAANGADYCVGVGVSVNILLESNVFSEMRMPIDTSFRDTKSVAVSWGNLYTDSLPSPDLGTDADVFVPPYPYTLEPVQNVSNTVSQNVGPH